MDIMNKRQNSLKLNEDYMNQKKGMIRTIFRLVLSLMFFLLVSCKTDRQERQDNIGKPTKEQPVKPISPNVNVYIENSLSMRGYIKGNTSFKTDLRELLTLLNYHYDSENVKLYFINKEVYPINSNNNIDYITNLTNETFKVGLVNESDLNKVFGQVLDKTTNNTLSIVVSDCIYSVGGSASALSVQKTGIEEAFLNKNRKGVKLSTEIVQLNSQFDGIYYDKNNGKHVLKGELRPYYLIALGNDAVMSDLNTKIPFNNGKFEGFKNKLFLTTKNYSDDLYYTLLKTKSDVGRYSFNRSYSTQNYKRGIENIKQGRGKFTFSVGIDFSKIPLESNYLLEKSNYKIEQGNYKIKSITAVNQTTSQTISSPSQALLHNGKQKVTHYVTFEATSAGQSDLVCVLENKIPGWVYATNSMDDTAQIIDTKRTFGFQYLVEGIDEANKLIQGETRSIFKYNIKIE